MKDAYSRKIVGWHLDKTMEGQGSVRALDIALLSRGISDKLLIYYSDRSVQYCSWKYVDRLRDNSVGDPNLNAMVKRVFQTLKEDFGLRGFVSFFAAREAVEKAINNYNAMRPHASIGYLTPYQAPYRTGSLLLKWYPYEKYVLECAIPS